MKMIDFLLFTIYVFVIYFFLSRSILKVTDRKIKMYLQIGFWLKVIAALCFASLMTYYPPGDSLNYFRAGNQINSLISKDLSNISILFMKTGSSVLNDVVTGSEYQYLLQDPASLFCIKICTVLSFLSFGKFLVANFLFSMISFSGAWRLFRYFYQEYPHLHLQICVTFLAMPGFIFWSAGIGKEAIILTAVGWLFYATNQIISYHHKLITNILISLLCVWILAIQIQLVLLTILPFLILFIIFKKHYHFKNIYAQLASFLILFLVLFALEVKLIASPGYGSVTEYSATNLSPGQELSSQTYLIKKSQKAVLTTLYRPFIGESTKSLFLESGLESALLIIFNFTLFVLLIVEMVLANSLSVVYRVIRDPAIWFCVCFTILSAFVIGSTTMNFGTMVRIKSFILPFYLLGMFLVLDKNERVRISRLTASNSL